MPFERIRIIARALTGHAVTVCLHCADKRHRTGSFIVKISPKTIASLGWKHGDKLIVEVDKPGHAFRLAPRPAGDRHVSQPSANSGKQWRVHIPHAAVATLWPASLFQPGKWTLPAVVIEAGSEGLMLELPPLKAKAHA